MRLTGGSTAVAFLSGRVPIRLAPRASPGRGLPRHECLASLTADAVRLVALALLAPRFARTLPVRQRVRQSVLALAHGFRRSRRDSRPARISRCSERDEPHSAGRSGPRPRRAWLVLKLFSGALARAPRGAHEGASESAVSSCLSTRAEPRLESRGRWKKTPSERLR
jgi:hypothetical protein